jgi:glucokinase
VSEGEDKEFNSRLVYQMAVQGDGPAQAIYQRVGESLGVMLASMINALNLPMYVLGGGVASAWEAFAPAMFAEVRRRSFIYDVTAPDSKTTGPRGKTTIITRALLGSDAGLYGAARIPLLSRK